MSGLLADKRVAPPRPAAPVFRRSTPSEPAVEVHAPTPVTPVERRRRHRSIRPSLAVAILILAVLTLAALLPTALTGQDPLAGSAADAFLAPGGDHWLGTDENGRDLWARLVHGAAPSLGVALAATALGIVLGGALGLAAGLGGRLTDGIASRFVEVLMAFPEALMALVIITFWGAGIGNAIFAIALMTVPRNARLVRAQAQIVRSAGYVEAARALGLSPLVLVWRHIVPNAMRPVVVLAPITVGGSIAAASMLSFLGFGAPPPAPEWGAMLSIGRNFLATAWWLVAVPAGAITATVLALSVVGQALSARGEGRAA